MQWQEEPAKTIDGIIQQENQAFAAFDLRNGWHFVGEWKQWLQDQAHRQELTTTKRAATYKDPSYWISFECIQYV